LLKASPIAFQQVHGNIKSFHSSARVENELILGGLAIGVSAVTLQYAMKGYQNFAQKRAEGQSTTTEGEADHAADVGSTKATDATSYATEEETVAAAKAQAEAAAKKRAAKAAAQPSFFANLFNNSWFAKNFYEGGFEDKMTKREAALILGVRESANQERIKDAHRRIMQINHPDKGGSAYVTAKVNEAKDMLIKGK
jgi:hypothetical protein